ncbi:hypothetical protein L3Q67_32680 [Saccharothrix sp. AJ9571]|nr:hypothetical protein L3Q67_32680 [Saccharothrix sp. AJ9571]
MALGRPTGRNLTKISGAVSNRACASRLLSELSTSDGSIDHCHRYHATRAEPLRELDHFAQAQAVERRALELTAHSIEQSLLRQPFLTASYSPLLA